MGKEKSVLPSTLKAACCLALTCSLSLARCLPPFFSSLTHEVWGALCIASAHTLQTEPAQSVCPHLHLLEPYKCTHLNADTLVLSVPLYLLFKFTGLTVNDSLMHVIPGQKKILALLFLATPKHHIFGNSFVKIVCKIVCNWCWPQELGLADILNIHNIFAIFFFKFTANQSISVSWFAFIIIQKCLRKSLCGIFYIY